MEYKSKIIVSIILLLLVSCVYSKAAKDPFNFPKYDLDSFLNLPKPDKELVVYKPMTYLILITLLQYPKPCNTNLLKASMFRAGIKRNVILRTPMTQCIRVKSLAGKEVKLYILDTFAINLPKRVKLNKKVWLIVMIIFNTQKDGPGILVRGFSRI